MKKTAVSLLVAVASLCVLPLAAPQAHAHCQVPCGIYDDPARFTELKEHVTTISKAMAQIAELAGKSDAQSLQQLSRWVANKESHAQEVQQIALDYFLAQRIKLPADAAGKDAYLAQLAAVHEIVVHAMKCKQNADPAAAEKLGAAVDAYEKLYNK